MHVQQAQIRVRHHLALLISRYRVRGDSSYSLETADERDPVTTVTEDSMLVHGHSPTAALSVGGSAPSLGRDQLNLGHGDGFRSGAPRPIDADVSRYLDPDMEELPTESVTHAAGIEETEYRDDPGTPRHV
jgi:hypothetical protein